jgi:hypothetical protein
MANRKRMIALAVGSWLAIAGYSPAGNLTSERQSLMEPILTWRYDVISSPTNEKHIQGIPASNEVDSQVVFVRNEIIVPRYIALEGTRIASQVFENIGLHIQWRQGNPSSDQIAKQQAVVVTIRSACPHPAVAGFALQYQGAVAICYGNMKWTERNRDFAARYFGYVLAHEITHALARSDRHSQTGLMKAQWTRQDYDLMMAGLMRLESTDIELIRKGLADRALQKLEYAAGHRLPVETSGSSQLHLQKEKD